MADTVFMDNIRTPLCYEIRLRGVLGETLLGAFPDLRPETHHNETWLIGELPDQAALHGVLAQVGTLGLHLLEVRRRQS